MLSGLSFCLAVSRTFQAILVSVSLGLTGPPLLPPPAASLMVLAVVCGPANGLVVNLLSFTGLCVPEDQRCI